MKDRFRVGATLMNDNVFVTVSVEGAAAGIALVDRIRLRIL